MEKILTFDEWAVAITKALGLNENALLIDQVIDNKKHTITLKQFFNTVLRHEGWQPVIMRVGDYFCAQYLFHDGMNYTSADVLQTKTFMLDYFADFVLNAIQSGYKF